MYIKTQDSKKSSQKYFAKLRLAVVNRNDDKVSLNSFKVVKSNLKRFLDIAISVTVFVFIFSWLFPLISCLIKFTSKGPIFFKQKRVGLNGDLFLCYKFRTMYVEKVLPRYVPATETDPRITKIGRFLRKSNLDELPQLINVLKGEMSIVGPRPHAIAFHEAYSKFIPFIDKRLLVKPGITGLAQIRGYRGDVIDEELNKKRTFRRVAFDIVYIRKWELYLDFYIIVVTAKQMLFRQTNGH